MFVKRKMSLWLFIVIIILLGIVAISLLLSFNTLERKHEDEIRKVISSVGGQVVKIEKVDSSNTPFEEDFNKSNIIYKIIYTKTSKEYVAWYRGVNVVTNIHAENPSARLGGYGEKWIIPTDS